MSADRVEEMIAVRAAIPQAMRALLTPARMMTWVAPDITVVPLTSAPILGPGDRFRIESVAGPAFEVEVEAVSDREVAFSFTGPWSGRERWSFIADGAETVVRRVYEVEGAGSGLAMIAWQMIGRMLVAAHYKLELPRFRAAVERDPGPRGEIAARAREPEPAASPPPFPVDEG